MATRLLIPVALAVVLALPIATALAQAVTIGKFCSETDGSPNPNGREQVALRTVPNANGSEVWFAYSTRSLQAGCETVREIWLGRHACNALSITGSVATTWKALLFDSNTCSGATVSYSDPAWSPDGRFLAYAAGDRNMTTSGIYVQEYAIGTSIATASTPIGAPITVVPPVAGVTARRPAWSPSGQELAFDSNAAGSLDLYRVSVFPVGSPILLTFDATHAELAAAWSPNGGQLAYQTNGGGSYMEIDLLDLALGVTAPAESAPLPGAHNSPSWSQDGSAIYFDAPSQGMVNLPSSVWRLNLATQRLTELVLDPLADTGVDVSRIANMTANGDPYDNIAFASLAQSTGLQIWAGPCLDKDLAVNLIGNTGTVVVGSGSTVTIKFSPIGTDFALSDVLFDPYPPTLVADLTGAEVTASSVSVQGGTVRLEFTNAAIGTALGVAVTTTPTVFSFTLNARLRGSCSRIKMPITLTVKK